jgi:UDP-glucose:(heptosyl)LPS alpha-1,3-glucosyltransferase
MKVAIVSIRFDTRGGSERRTYKLVKGLIEAGHEVDIFAAEVDDLDLDAEVNIVPTSKGPSFIRVMSFTRNVNRMLKGRHDYDVVHNQIRPFTDGIVTVGGGCHAEYLDKTGKRFKLLNPLNHVVLKMERERYREDGCRAVIANSEYAKRGLLRRYPIARERVFVAYNGVDSSKFDPARIRAGRAALRKKYGLTDEPVALFLGSGFERKGLVTAINALALLKSSEQEIFRLKLLVVGADNPRPYLSAAIKRNVTGKVIFAGPTRTPEDFYGMADIFVLPTYYDPFSNAALEAMASALPVITTKENGVSEIIEDGENGFIMRVPGDAMDLAAKLSYLSCEKVRKQVGEKARRTAEGFTWDKTLQKTLEVYEKAYQGRE